MPLLVRTHIVHTQCIWNGVARAPAAFRTLWWRSSSSQHHHTTAAAAGVNCRDAGCYTAGSTEGGCNSVTSVTSVTSMNGFGRSRQTIQVGNYALI
jgi:hypothetical protein